MMRVLFGCHQPLPELLRESSLHFLDSTFQARTPAQSRYVQGPQLGVDDQLRIDGEPIGAPRVTIRSVFDFRRAAGLDQVGNDESDDLVFAAFSIRGRHLSTLRALARRSDHSGSVQYPAKSPSLGQDGTGT